MLDLAAMKMLRASKHFRQVFSLITFFAAITAAPLVCLAQNIDQPAAAQEGLDVLRQQSLDQYLRFWRDNPEKALDLKRWCQDEVARNGGVTTFDFPIHESALEVVEAVNMLNREMGFSCYQIRGVVDETGFYQPLTDPTPKDKKFYETVRKARAAIIPLLGYLITAKPIYDSLHSDFSWSNFSQHGGKFMQANMKGFLEFQFAYFSSLWSVIFSQKKFPLLQEHSRTYFQRAANTLKKPFNMMLKAANSFFDRTGNKVRASHVWISFVNLFGYTFAMGTALSLGEFVFGQAEFEGTLQTMNTILESGLKMVWREMPMSIAFNFTFMFYQDRSGVARNQNLWSETSRLLYESVPALLFNSFRGVSAIFPALSEPMLASQLAIGGILSALMAAKVSGTKHFAKETGQMLTKMEASLSPEDRHDTAKFAQHMLNTPLEDDATGHETQNNACDLHLSPLSYLQARIFEYFRWGFNSNALQRLSQPRELK